MLHGGTELNLKVVTRLRESRPLASFMKPRDRSLAEHFWTTFSPAGKIYEREGRARKTAEEIKVRNLPNKMHFERVRKQIHFRNLLMKIDENTDKT